jgi:hypothetical protein
MPKGGKERGQVKAHIREDAIELVEEERGEVTRRLRREAVTFGEKRRMPSPSRYLFGPISVGD